MHGDQSYTPRICAFVVSKFVDQGCAAIVAHRRTPLVIYSNNGTNFRGACTELRKELEKIDSNKQREYAFKNGLRRILNPPDASVLNLEIEHAVNYRPLAQISADPNDCEAITPSHFLIGICRRVK